MRVPLSIGNARILICFLPTSVVGRVLTEITLTLETHAGDVRVFTGSSSCSPSDHFEKGTGRKLAWTRLLANWKAALAGTSSSLEPKPTRDDLVALWKAVMPEYYRKQWSRRQAAEMILDHLYDLFSDPDWTMDRERIVNWVLQNMR